MTKLVLLGAGASADAGLPVNNRLMKCVEQFLSDFQCADGMIPPMRTFRELKDELEKQRQTTVFPEVGIEDIATAAQVKHELENGSLFSPDQGLGLVPFEPGSYGPKTTPYLNVHQTIKMFVYLHIRKLSSLAVNNSYLSAMIRESLDKNIPIFSLNFDYVIEKCCERMGVPVCVGVQEGHSPDDIQWMDGAVKLCKLHGSVDWDIQAISEEHPHSIKFTRKGLPGNLGNHSWTSIFGITHKHSYFPPFKQLYRCFDEALDEAKAVYVIGYSFRDPHINQSLYWWCRKSPENRILVANGPDFSADRNVPNITFGNVTSRTLRKHVEVFPMLASEAISHWFGEYRG